MAKVETISVELPSGLASTVRDAVECGDYPDTGEVVRDALRDWKVKRRVATVELDELRRLYQEGIDSGPGIDEEVVFFQAAREIRGNGRRVVPRVVYLPRAVIDLEEITDYVARDNPVRAVSFREELRAHCSRVAENPAAYMRRDDVAQGARMAVHGRYLILFHSIVDGVEIVRILHGARRLPRPI